MPRFVHFDLKICTSWCLDLCTFCLEFCTFCLDMCTFLSGFVHFVWSCRGAQPPDFSASDRWFFTSGYCRAEFRWWWWWWCWTSSLRGLSPGFEISAGTRREMPTPSSFAVNQGETVPNNSKTGIWIQCSFAFTSRSSFQELVYGLQPTRELTSPSLWWLEQGEHLRCFGFEHFWVQKAMPWLPCHDMIAQRDGNWEGRSVQGDGVPEEVSSNWQRVRPPITDLD